MLVSTTIIRTEGVQGVDPDLDRMLHFLGERWLSWQDPEGGPQVGVVAVTLPPALIGFRQSHLLYISCSCDKNTSHLEVQLSTGLKAIYKQNRRSVIILPT